MLKLNYPKFWQQKGLFAYLLLPFSIIFYLLSVIRKYLVSPISLGAKVICVGNLTVGGTGKTQAVILLAQILLERNVSFLIITKGYNSKLKSAKIVEDSDLANDVGDEALILKNFGTVIAARKIQYSLPLIKSLAPQVIIVDDGMQNPSFYKDFILLTIDSIRMVGNGFLLPAGPLRTPVKQGLDAASAIIMVGDTKYNFDINAPIFSAKIDPVQAEDNFDKSKSYYAFCGIGNPEKFLNSLKKMNLNLQGYKIFSDHHNYTSADINYLKACVVNSNSVLITTEKDYVKIHDKLDTLCLKVHLIVENIQTFKNLIYERII